MPESQDRFAIANLTGGQLNAIVKMLGGDFGAREFLAGRKVVNTVNLRVDLGAAPYVPLGLTVKSHRSGGILNIVPSQITTSTTENQRTCGERGEKLKKIFCEDFLRHHHVLNCNVLDALLADTALIPANLKPESLVKPYPPHFVFWGTVYEEQGRECVRALLFNVHIGAWVSKLIYIDMLFHEWAPAAIYPKAA